MAEQRAQDVVNQTQSVGDLSPSDAPATTSTTDIQVSGDEVAGEEDAPKENGITAQRNSVKMDELEDASCRSDTDTSRAEGSVAGDKGTEQKSLKKFVAKPVSFAKYSVPKVIAASAATKGTDKAVTTLSSTSSALQAGRPRLVAKTTGSLQSKAKPFKSATPDPMQVWNKNRITPQPSTKHLTDEELKQQYGIHLTSRIQEDGDGKEAKWADIDDDEDDWAPETIEWNDGTKSTLTPADVLPQPTEITAASVDVIQDTKPAPPPKILTPHFTSSVGPNATVLKLGASAERQQAQKAAASLSRSTGEKASLATSRGAAPAPAPSKSPWAPLPPVEKVSPIAVNPNPIPVPGRFPPGHPQLQAPPNMPAPSPAKEISADDFNRTWRDSTSAHPRELYMPNSGRYEAVPQSKRRMSRNDQNFRAAAVLQRPSQSDIHAPAEPSAAFQTNRTSTDSVRRRASSNISGGSGPFVRRMSIKSAEVAPPVFETQGPDVDASMRPASKDGPPAQAQTPTYSARAGNDSTYANVPSTSDADLEAQRVAQRALMKENIERARKRKIEEEQRQEAEKQERIRLKLASLGPDPRLESQKTEETLKNKDREHDLAISAPGMTTATNSPPKPPQPLATGEPQQYGMMKVHPLDTLKKMGPPHPRAVEAQRSPTQSRVEPNFSKDSTSEDNPGPSPVMTGVRSVPELRRTSDQDVTGSEPSPKLPKPSSVGNDARSGWKDIRPDHRSPQMANLWGLPNNKALGNGTFDQSLAGYAPQDLSRTSSTAHGWMNGRTPQAGRSPQIQHVHHAIPDTRSYSFQSIASPDQGPLAADSEIDSLFPTTKPAPIAPPQPQQQQPSTNGYQLGHRGVGLDSWNNFQQAANQQERAENEKFQKELQARREEELRTGVRQGPQYTFNETWRQVQVGEQAGQRQISSVSQTNVPASNVFGAVGSMSAADVGPRMMNGPPGRGSRFFPHHLTGNPVQDRRAITYSHPEPPRTPSPPPAEEYASLHPAFDGEMSRPVVHFPREKAVVKLPPNMPPTPPSPADSGSGPTDEPQIPLTWAARVSMPAPGPLRSVSTPLAQTPSWQERFNGLFAEKKISAGALAHSLAVASSTKEPLDVQHLLVPAASVSMPSSTQLDAPQEVDDSVTTKDVESEDDLFEDREPGSLPAINFPRDSQHLRWARTYPSRIAPIAIEATSIHPYMVNNLFERHSHAPVKPQYALIRFPGSEKSIKKDIPIKGQSAAQPGRRFHNGGPSSYGGKPRNRGGFRSRQTSKAH